MEEMEEIDLEFNETIDKVEDKTIFETYSEREAKEYISKHLVGIKIKGNSHISPNKRLAFFRKFKCFDHIKLISIINEHKIAFELLTKNGEVLSSEGAPAFLTKDMNDKTFKKFNSSLMGRALKNYGILGKEETEGMAEDDTTTGEDDDWGKKDEEKQNENDSGWD